MQFLSFAIEQILFTWCLNALVLAFKYFFKAIVYSPQLFTGYLVCKLFLNKTDSALLWIAIVILVAALIQFVIIFLKQIIGDLKTNGNILWVPLLVVCLAYTCIFPACIIFGQLKNLMRFLSPEKAVAMTWLFTVAFGVYLYFRYDFLNHRSD